MSNPVYSTVSQSANKLMILLNETFLPPTIFNDVSITFGTVTAVTASDHDTEVEASGVPGRGYYGSATVMYTRVPLSNLAGLISLYSTTDFTLGSILSAINTQFGTFIDSVDLEAVSIPTLTQGGPPQTLTLVATAASLGWKGQVDITLNWGFPDLKTVIGKTSLGVFGWMPPEQVSGRDLLFNYDFTSWRDSLLPKWFPLGTLSSYQSYGDYATFQGLCASIGIPWFPNGDPGHQVTDNATSAIADSNKSFDRVVIHQPPATSGILTGPLYFHYNVLENR